MMDNRRRFVRWGLVVGLLGVVSGGLQVRLAHAVGQREIDAVVTRGLDWVANRQSRVGHWAGNNGMYPTAMTSLAGIALLSEGSTTTQGKYAENIRLAVDFLVNRSNTNGLIGSTHRDDRYTYGHGFAMLFLSQVLGEEEDVARREELIDVLTRAVQFTGEAQTKAGGWGYVSAKDGNDFDEGSTTVTQVQGLRGCRNAGIEVPREIIDKAIKYIHGCMTKDGGVRYSFKSGGGSGRPAITAAAVACLFNAGEYDGKYTPKMLAFCHKNLGKNMAASGGHWHYAHYYYAQVMYREGGKSWDTYRDRVCAKIVSEATREGDRYGFWAQGHIGKIYSTAINLTILQLEKGCLPIYQR